MDYDRHTCIAEKRHALKKWTQHLMRVIGSESAQSSGMGDVSHGEPVPGVERA
jgi:hypothetical protein